MVIFRKWIEEHHSSWFWAEHILYLCNVVVRMKHIYHCTSVNSVSSPIFLYYSSKNKYAKMIKCNCSLCVVVLFFVVVVFFCRHLQFWFMFSCTLRMSCCLWDFFPYFLCLVWFINKNRIAVIDMSAGRFCVHKCMCLCTRNRDLLSLSICRRVMHNHPIHIIQMRILFIKVESIHFSLMLSLSFSVAVCRFTLWFIAEDHSTNQKFVHIAHTHTDTHGKAQKVNKSTENGKNAPVGPKWSILEH